MRGALDRRLHTGENGRASVTVVAIVLIFLLGAKVLNYVSPESIRVDALQHDIAVAESGFQSWYRNTALFHTCAPGTTKVIVPGGYVCSSLTAANDVYTKTFETAPIDGGVRKAIDPSVTTPSQQTADAMLNWSVVVPGFATYQAGPGTDWARLDPYRGQYWHFYYYSMRPTVALVDAYVATGNHAYLDRLWSIDNSFIDESGTSTQMWSDEHSVAYRAMALTYQWWVLREYHELTVEQSSRLLGEISKEADFLADPNRYQPDINRGTNESAALLLVAEDFPLLPHAAEWSDLARSRFAQSLDQLIDADGALIENSPFDQMYELDKLWQVYKFTTELGIYISDDFEAKIKSMLNYATYLLQPDGSVPLLGSSLADKVHDSGTFAELATLDPEFQYVLSRGASGAVPAHTSITFPNAGQTIMRSGWDQGVAFTDSSYLTFNVGAYRTLHSQLDSLGLTFYDNGKTLLPPGGLYTYTPGAMHDYFHGTASHNTVLVDGVSQTQGAASAGPLTTTSGITYQSAATSVYDGVTDLRTVVMADKDHFIVIDRLSAPTAHRYQQMWHLFPGATVSQNGLSVTGNGKSLGQQVTISQLQPGGISLSMVKGQLSPPAGLCSEQFDVAVPCQQLAYLQTGQSAAYTTLISAGSPNPNFHAGYNAATSTLTVRSGGGTTTLVLGTTTGRTISIDSHPVVAQAVGSAIQGAELFDNWTGSIPGALTVDRAADDANCRTLVLAADKDRVRATDLTAAVNLSSNNLQIRMKLVNAARIAGASLGVSSDHGRSYTRIALQEVYERRWTGEWLTMSLGRDLRLSGVPGHWTADSTPVEWAHVNSMQLAITPRAGAGPTPAIEVEWVRRTPQQRSGVVSIVFDDGYQSILPAAEYLHAHHFPANVAVIGKVIEPPWLGYLNLYQLRDLQNKFGWNMVNHSFKHLDAVATYDSRDKLGAYEQDIVEGATWLQQAGLNSAPNWYIYPHGATNSALEGIVGRFYTFARSTGPGPESFPFGNPWIVKTFELHSPHDASDDKGSRLTPVSQAVAAIRDAKEYHTSLIITLHRIKATASDHAGYPLADFKEIVDALAASGLPVLTLSQLDAMNGVPETDHITVTPAVPALVTVAVTSTPAPPAHEGFWGWFWNVV